LPRSTKSKRAAETGNVATLDREEETIVTTATDQEADEDQGVDPRFTFESFAAPKDFQPDRKTPGRVRQPSYFDDVLRSSEVFESGEWQMVPVSGEEHAQATLRELNRAKLHLNKTGLEEDPPLPEIGLDLDVREDAVYYKSRTAQKRERRANGTAIAEADAADQEELEFDQDEDDS
jgi:hypothetical protein